MDGGIVCLLGSPRPDGNSTRIARAFCGAAAEHGIAVREYRLSELDFDGCRFLNMCKTSLDHCGQTDDLTGVLEAIHRAGLVVMATPIYFTDVSAHLKKCIDRMYSFFVPDYPAKQDKSRMEPGKDLVFIQTQGEPEPAYADTLERYNRSFEALGFAAPHLIRVSGVREIGDINGGHQSLASARRLAETLVARPARSAGGTR